MLSTSAPQAIAFRSSTHEDCAHLALLADMATRRLTSFLWGQTASPGQSAFEIGRNRWQAVNAYEKFDLFGTMQRVKCPVLMLYGEHFVYGLCPSTNDIGYGVDVIQVHDWNSGVRKFLIAGDGHDVAVLRM